MAVFAAPPGQRARPVAESPFEDGVQVVEPALERGVQPREARFLLVDHAKKIAGNGAARQTGIKQKKLGVYLRLGEDVSGAAAGCTAQPGGSNVQAAGGELHDDLLALFGVRVEGKGNP